MQLGYLTSSSDDDRAPPVVVAVVRFDQRADLRAERIGTAIVERLRAMKLEAVSPLLVSLDSRFPPADGLRWVPLAELRELPLGKRDQRLRDLLGTPGQVPLEAPSLAALIKACAAALGL